MSGGYPKLRITARDGQLLMREGVSICFYMRRSHQQLRHEVRQVLERYLRVVGPQALRWYVDAEGDCQRLDAAGWERLWQGMADARSAGVHLLEHRDTVSGYAFEYHGRSLASSPEQELKASSAVAFWLPTEYLEAQGPERVRELALELARTLPFNSGHASLSFHVLENYVGVSEAILQHCFRYPGMDIPELGITSLELGTRVRGAYWLTFLGAPVLEELGGAEGLRARLSLPDVTVEPMGEGRVVVTLGEWPEAGDTEQGRMLPLHRQLARVLEPWLYEERTRRTAFTEQDMKRWHRRFLD
jgi:hypothetical protein